MELKGFKIRELSPHEGDTVATLTIEEAKELDFETFVSVLPNGVVVHSFDELLEQCQGLDLEEPQVYRFQPLVGG